MQLRIGQELVQQVAHAVGGGRIVDHQGVAAIDSDVVVYFLSCFCGAECGRLDEKW